MEGGFKIFRFDIVFWFKFFINVYFFVCVVVVIKVVIYIRINFFNLVMKF